MQVTSLILKASIIAWMIPLQIPEINAVEHDHQQDVVYGYKDGMALVMDVFTPTGKRNGAGVIFVMGGGMTSRPTWSHRVASGPQQNNLVKAIRGVVLSLLKEGYIVFAAAHSSQPKYTIDEIRPDMSRAVRFIRHHSERFGIDPQRLGIMGGSSGGHLSLLAATAPPEADLEAKDPVDRESSQVQAVVSYYASTDMLNVGTGNTTLLEHFHSLGSKPDATFDFHQWNKETGRFERVTDPEARREFYRQNSPLIYVSADDPPMLLFHGDQDHVIPLQQSKRLAEVLRKFKIPHRLIVVEGKGHGWVIPESESAEILNWFGQHLLGKER